MTRSEFINKYYNFAKAAAAGTGISPILILSQAWLESAGGKSILAAKHNNFFGIKSSKNWLGKTVNMRTREQRKDGTEYFVIATFRAYNSPTDSFLDLIKLLQGNPRYKNAGLFLTPNNYAAQADSLQRAGYATDLNYASLLKNIGNSFVATLKKINPITKSIIPLAILVILILSIS